MFARLTRFLARHPLIRDALVWAIPAMIFGAVLRIVLISYLPYAYWGADSRSYYSFAHKLITEGYISLDEKRRFLYPILMVPVSLLPGSPLRWLAVLQHALGVITLVPLAYIVRKTLVHWRLWIVPVTLLFAGLPVIVWYEHELLGENVFFATLLWAFAGWCAWVLEVLVGAGGEQRDVPQVLEHRFFRHRGIIDRQRDATERWPHGGVGTERQRAGPRPLAR